MVFEHPIFLAPQCPMLVLCSVPAVEDFHGEGVVEESLVAGEDFAVGGNCMSAMKDPLGTRGAFALG